MNIHNSKSIAIIYDFDGTLSPGNMQEHSFIKELNMDKDKFWNEVKLNAKKHDMNEILSYMELMIKKANEKKKGIRIEDFKNYGKDIKFFKGVEKYFDAINQHAAMKGIAIEHYIISSGLLDILKGTSIFHNFKKVYASAFKFNEEKIAVWPAVAIDYTAKTQILFRINKGINSIWDNRMINKYVAEEERVMPFSRMIYIGDGETDIPAMKMVNYQGGISIAVYNPTNDKARQGCQSLLLENRATYIAPANYNKGTTLFQILQYCIDKITAEIRLNVMKDEEMKDTKK